MRIGVDLGGTKIEAICLGESGEILWRRRAPTPQGDYDGTLAVIRELVQGAEAELAMSGTVGIGTPGTVSARSGMMINANSVVLNGKPLLQDLQAVLGRPVRIENDANCFALSEAIDGAGAARRMVFGVILGTGVGGGLVFARQLWAGGNHIAGEWGHNPLPWSSDDEIASRSCYCGRSGCIETFLSGQGLLLNYGLGPEITASTVAARAADGESPAIEALELYGDRLARSLASVANLIDPDIIVLGGGLSNITALYEGLQARIERYAFSDGINTPIVAAKHGDSSGVRGAAWLWPIE